MIFKCLNFTWDSPSKTKTGMMPVSDVKLLSGTECRMSGRHPEIDINAPTKLRTGSLKKVILFLFYKKPLASKVNNRFREGLPNGFKIATGVQETVGCLKNTSRDFPNIT